MTSQDVNKHANTPRMRVRDATLCHTVLFRRPRRRNDLRSQTGSEAREEVPRGIRGGLVSTALHEERLHAREILPINSSQNLLQFLGILN